MDNKDKDVKSALDELFGSDFIEIDVNEKKQDDINTTMSDLLDDVSNSIIKKDNKNTNNNDIDSNDNIKEEQIDKKDEENKNEFVPNYVTTIHNKKESTNKKKNSINKQYIFLISIIVLIVLITVIYLLLFKEKTIKCTSSAKDIGYKYTDEYLITHKGNKITYLNSKYSYTALTDEYKNEIDAIKNEKLPVLLNSNGMDGFTYVYESTDEYFKITGYIDFKKIDFKKIDKLNQDLVKVSFYKINSKLTYKNLKKSLEKDGYTCTNIK